MPNLKSYDFACDENILELDILESIARATIEFKQQLELENA